MRQIVETAVAAACIPDAYRDLLCIPLRQRGKVLSGDLEPRWPVLVLAVSVAVRGPALPAAQVAAAVEVFMAALDVLDDIQDGDPSPLIDTAGIGQAVGVAGALLVLAYELLGRLEEVGLPADRIPAFIQGLSRCALTAGGGQYLDLASEGRPDLSLDEALDIGRRKGGELAAAACRLGALVGTQDENELALYESLGRHLGTVEQLANDLQDAAVGAVKTDRERGKRTLPLVYAGARDGREIDECEAQFFTRVVMEGERERVREILERLAARGHAVAALARLVS
ncbi:MAG: polyprenyl synthetase family protein [Sphaerobacter sp.]|nr:polyprenyl synthetase family protein [Sphaerobacter sp.]